MIIRDNTNTIWIMGAIILANMYMLHDSMFGFFFWMAFAFVIIILDVLRMNSEIKRIRNRMIIDHIQSEAQKFANKKPRRKRK